MKIPRNRIDIRPIIGIYFLFKDEELVYIGQSINVTKRVFEHIKDKSFHTYTYKEYPRKLLDEMERKFISIYSPKYNTVLKGKVLGNLEVIEEGFKNEKENTILIHKGKAFINMNGNHVVKNIVTSRNKILTFEGIQGFMNMKSGNGEINLNGGTGRKYLFKESTNLFSIM